MDLKYTNDFINNFWSLYVVVITLVSVIGCGVFLWMQGNVKHDPGQTTGHVWDETLAEYSNPLPNWWRWMFYITVVFALVYLAIFPGLGSFNGKLDWTMRSQYDAEMKKADEQYAPIFNKLSKFHARQLTSSTESLGSVPKRAPPRIWLAMRARAFSAL
jgi:cytochrome c oxidase cbb3-type subunit 3